MQFPLMRFLEPSDSDLAILIIESKGYAEKAREMFPRARIYSVAAESAGDSGGIIRTELDYRETPLPFEKKFFDIVIADNFLADVFNPQDIASGIGTFIKDTGMLLTSFENIRCHRVIAEIMDGHYYAIVRRRYAKPEFERLLYASFYKDVFFSPLRENGDEKLIKKLEDAGFENFSDDLDVKFWLAQAFRSTRGIAALKSEHGAAERRELSKLLRRVEYDIDPGENAASLWRLIKKSGFSPDYLAMFAHESVFYHERFYEILMRESPEDFKKELDEWILAAKEIEFDYENAREDF